MFHCNFAKAHLSF